MSAAVSCSNLCVCVCVYTYFKTVSDFLLVFAVFVCAVCRVKLWASAFGGEMKSISAKYSGSQLLQKVSTFIVRGGLQVSN